VGRVAHGIPDRVHRLKALGNAIVPQMAYYIGTALIKDFQTKTLTNKGEK
jgi:DNA (cytosine-5)-methyltransferase 1